jgi:GDPmannose 4,6-dehydratase
MKTALITGIGGQDGSYLSELLLSLGYRVHGLLQPGGGQRAPLLSHLSGRLSLHETDLLDGDSLAGLLREIRPGEIYNLAGQSFVPAFPADPTRTGAFDGLAVESLLDAIRRTDPSIRFYQASTSEMFGSVAISPQDETTPFEPRNPYGEAKVHAHRLTVNARAKDGFFAVSGILFNHESPRRGERFVTRKITLGAARIAAGRQETLSLGNLDARRDWGFSGDYVRAMWMMLQRDDPTDYVVGTGEARSVREFAAEAFALLNLDWRRYVVEDPTLRRPGEADRLVANPRRAREELGWSPTVAFRDLVKMMIEADVERVKAESKFSQGKR